MKKLKRKLCYFQVRRLHIFSDGTTDIVAFDPDDARRAWMEWAGGAEWDETYEPFDYQRKDTAIVEISCELDEFEAFKKCRPPFSRIGTGKHYPFVSAPAWLWCLWNGRGFLSSME